MLATVLGCVCLGIASLIYLSVSIIKDHSHQMYAHFPVSCNNTSSYDVIVSYLAYVIG